MGGESDEVRSPVAPLDRAGEFAALQAFFDRVGQRGLIEVAGEPWVGKSALIEHAVARAPGWTVVRATDATAGPRPLEPAPGDRGVILLADDAHRLPDAAIATVTAALRQPPPVSPLVAVVAYRRRQVPPRLRAVLAETRVGVESTKLNLGPVSDEALSELLPSGVGGREGQTLLREAGGNPGLLLALVAARTVGAEPMWDASAWPLLSDVLRLPLGDLDRLSDQALRLAQAAAVMDGSTEADLLQSVSGLSVADFFVALDELASQDILRPFDVVRTFRFRHPLLRLAAYLSAGPGWLLGAHARAAAALSARGGMEAERVRQAAQSLSGVDEREARLLRREAERLIWRAPARAARWLRATVEASNQPMDDNELFAHRIALGSALAIAGHLSASLSVLPASLRRAPGIHLDLWVGAAEWRCTVQRLVGRQVEAGGRLRMIAAGLPAHAWRLRLRLRMAQTALALECGAVPGDDLEHDGPTGSLDPVPHAHMLALRAASAAASGCLTVAADLIAATARVLDGLGDEELAPGIEALLWLARAEAHVERDGAAEAHLGRALDIAESCGLVFIQSSTSLALANLFLRAGRIDEATRQVAHAVDRADRLGVDCPQAVALGMRARIAAIAGDSVTAGAAARRALRLVRSTREPWADKVRLALVDASSTMDDVELMTAVLDPALTDRMRQTVVVPERPVIGELFSRAAVRSSVDSAATGLPPVLGVSELMPLPVATALGMLIRARRLCGDDPEADAASAMGAAVVLGRVGRPLEAARAHLVAATAWSIVDDRRAASGERRAAETILTSCGAHGWRLPPAADQPGSVGSTPDLESLSRRELEIARLLSRGMTNQQIARSLALSHKTVETYMARMFKKLGVSSRAEVATAIGAAGLVARPRWADPDSA